MSEHFANHDPDSGHTENEQHIVGPLTYFTIFCCLLLGTALTIGASYLELGPWNPVLAILIAVIKATLVILFFMHIKYSSKLMKLTVGAGIFTFLILVGMSLSDYISRAWGQW
ncbi:cytochrome C oxidase subunit IV family protein [Acidicapsa ligni]|uniref:cytochrome C oxidase subunit IV family protein n=1 Tax=Acidicapsa ligni TaxID=542300 RepID=UPI0021E0C186|nr:cytochrome C oxidase subunit IV family protein [Acidicapsa ligni]